MYYSKKNVIYGWFIFIFNVNTAFYVLSQWRYVSETMSPPMEVYFEAEWSGEGKEMWKRSVEQQGFLAMKLIGHFDGHQMWR